MWLASLCGSASSTAAAVVWATLLPLSLDPLQCSGCAPPILPTSSFAPPAVGGLSYPLENGRECLLGLASLWLLPQQSGLVGYLDPVALLDFHLESSTKITPFAASGSPAAAEGASSVATTAAGLEFARTGLDLEIAPLVVASSLAGEGQEVGLMLLLL